MRRSLCNLIAAIITLELIMGTDATAKDRFGSEKNHTAVGRHVQSDHLPASGNHSIPRGQWESKPLSAAANLSPERSEADRRPLVIAPHFLAANQHVLLLPYRKPAGTSKKLSVRPAIDHVPDQDR